jgi:hypothetical protein
MSLLTIIQDATDLLSLARPAVVTSSVDATVRQLLSLANEEGKELAARYAWQALTVEATFVTSATPEQAPAIPADLDRFVANSFFNRTTRLPVVGPVTPQQWQALQAQPALGRVVLAFRQRSGQFLITPTPPAGQTIAYEYLSKNWAKSAAGQGKPRFMQDDDQTYLDEWLLTLGVRWRFRKSKGLDYAEDFETYEANVAQAMARDGGTTAISIEGGCPATARANLPEGNFGV